MASAGTVTIDFAAETAKFTAELKKVNDHLKSMESGFESLSNVAHHALEFLSVGAFVEFAKSALEAAKQLQEVAERIGTTAQSLSRLQFAAQESNVSVEVLNKSLVKFSVNIAEAAQGTGAAQGAFAELNVSAKELKGLSLEEQFAKIAEGFQNVVDPVDRVNVAVKLFGKQGAELVPLLDKGAEGIREFAAEADRLGITLDDRATKSIERSATALARFFSILKNNTANFAGDIVANLFGSGDQIADAQAKVDALIEQRKRLETPGTFIRTAVHGQIVEALDVQIKVAQQEVVALKFEKDRLDALKQINIEMARQSSLISEVTVDAKKVRIPGSPSNLDELALDFQDQQNEERLKKDKEFNDELSKQNGQLLIDLQNQRDAADKIFLREADATLREKLALEDFAHERERKLAEDAATQKIALEQNVFSAAVGFLNALGQRSKAAAIAAIVLNKALSIARAIQNTATAATAALAYGDPYTAAARVAYIHGLGAFEIGLIAATGALEVSNLSSGGSGGGGFSQPSYQSQTNTALSSDQLPAATAQKAVQVIFNGPIYNTDDFQRSIVDALKDISDRDVIIFQPTSAQAQVIRKAA